MQEQEFLEALAKDREPKKPIEKAQEARKLYLDSLSPEERAIQLSLWAQKAAKTRAENKEVKDRNRMVADRFKDILELDYVAFDDDEHVTVLDKILLTATTNTIRNPKTSFRDILEAQKVSKDGVDEIKTGISITIDTGGQDLGA